MGVGVSVGSGVLVGVGVSVGRRVSVGVGVLVAVGVYIGSAVAVVPVVDEAIPLQAGIVTVSTNRVSSNSQLRRNVCLPSITASFRVR